MTAAAAARGANGGLERRLAWLFAIATATFVPTIGFYYVGEEAIFPISSIEMHHTGDLIRQHLYGLNTRHNPLLNWLIVPVAEMAGWQHVLAVTRAIIAAATVCTGVVTFLLARALAGDRLLALAAAVIYLTFEDVLFYRGWLAYVDPFYAMLVTTSIAALWLGAERRSRAWLAAAVVLLVAAFLAKAFTAFVFYGVAYAVLSLDAGRRRFLWSPASLALQFAAPLLVGLWLAGLPHTEGQGPRLAREILAKLVPQGALAYAQQVAGFPLKTLAHLAPAALIALWYFWRRGMPRGPLPAVALPAAGIVALNFLPYWLAPQSSARYLLPVLPFAAIALAGLFRAWGEDTIRMLVRWIAVVLALKLVFALWAFPLYQREYRGENYALAARDIIARAGARPVYTLSATAAGLSVVGYLDAWRYPATPPVRWADDSVRDALVIVGRGEASRGTLLAHYRLGNDDLYLVCLGAACDPAGRR